MDAVACCCCCDPGGPCQVNPYIFAVWVRIMRRVRLKPTAALSSGCPGGRARRFVLRTRPCPPRRGGARAMRIRCSPPRMVSSIRAGSVRRPLAAGDAQAGRQVLLTRARASSHAAAVTADPGYTSEPPPAVGRRNVHAEWAKAGLARRRLIFSPTVRGSASHASLALTCTCNRGWAAPSRGRFATARMSGRVE